MNRKQRRAAEKQGGPSKSFPSLATQSAFANALRHHQMGQIDLAEQIYRQILSVDAKLGVIHLQRQQYQNAVDLISKAIAINPKLNPYHFNLGMALYELGKLEQAVASYQKALNLNPNDPATLSDLGVALHELGHCDEAMPHLLRAIELDPTFSSAYNNLGYVFQELDQSDQAISCYRKAIELNQDYADAHSNHGISMLLNGQFKDAWNEYEWRWQRSSKEQKPLPHFSRPQWQGERSLNGGNIYLWAEQGFGDSIQFIRYAPLVKAFGWNVVVAVQPKLKSLLKTIEGVTVISLGEDPPPFDFHCPLLSLPKVFETNLDTIPAAIPYLQADPERTAAWQTRLPNNKTRIGISWQGNSKTKTDFGRSLPLHYFAPLAEMPGVQLISLQKNDGVEQLQKLPSVLTLGPDFDNGPDAFLDTAAVMMTLDLIITSDTSIAHLAGALGRPVWVLLKAVPDWRWLRYRNDCPWYPTMRLFRQRIRGDWADVIEQVRQELSTSSGNPKVSTPTL